MTFDKTTSYNWIQDLGTSAVQSVNPMAPLPQETQLKKLQKEIGKKVQLARLFREKANEIKHQQPEAARELTLKAQALENRIFQLRANQEAATIDLLFARIGKFSLVSDLVIPGASYAITAVSLVGKSANVLYHYLKSPLSKEQQAEKVSSLVSEAVWTGTLTASSLIGTFIWKRL